MKGYSFVKLVSCVDVHVKYNFRDIYIKTETEREIGYKWCMNPTNDPLDNACYVEESNPELGIPRGR